MTLFRGTRAGISPQEGRARGPAIPGPGVVLHQASVWSPLQGAILFSEVKFSVWSYHVKLPKIVLYQSLQAFGFIRSQCLPLGLPAESQETKKKTLKYRAFNSHKYFS